MVLSESTRSKLLELVADLRSQKAIIEKRFRNEIEQIDRDLQAVQRTLDLMSGTDVTKSQLQLSMIDISLIVNAQNQKEALKVIAKQNQGVVNLTKAADLLIRAGRAKGKRRNLISTLWGFVHDSDEWEKASKGNYHLKEADGKINS